VGGPLSLNFDIAKWIERIALISATGVVHLVRDVSDVSAWSEHDQHISSAWSGRCAASRKVRPAVAETTVSQVDGGPSWQSEWNANPPRAANDFKLIAGIDTDCASGLRR